MSEPTSTSHDGAIPLHMQREGNGTGAANGAGHAERHDRVLQAVMFTDIENSSSLTGTLGPDRYAEVLGRHGQLFYEALAEVHPAKIENTGDGFMARFERPEEAVGVALRFQWLLRREEWNIGHPLRVRVGIHQGEILLMPAMREMPEMVGTAVSLASRVMGMADGGQVLLTREVFDEARQCITAIPEVAAEKQAALGWEAHGAYLVKGIEGPVEVFEVGERGHAPFRRPRNGPGAERSVSAEEEATLGWRPAAELEVPKRPGWRLVRALGQGGFGEVWLAENRDTRDERVFKFCFDVVRLRSFKREVMLFRLIREAIGPRRDIATLYEVQLESSPFFLESEYCGGGTLDEWLKGKRRADEVPLAERLKVVAAVARALAAAHSVGIIHRDVKPSNIFIEELPDGTVQPQLADFGIGELADRSAVEGLDLTGMLTMTADASRTGTRMYSAPEYMVGRPPSMLGDVYSLGVLLYQVVIADFQRPIGMGWERDVPDELLAEDIAACIDIEPERRLASAALLAERLETLEMRRAELNAKKAAARQKRELEERMVVQRAKTRKARAWAAVAIATAIVFFAIAFILSHSRNTIAAQREQERDRAYRADMVAAIGNIDNWRGAAARELVDRYQPRAGERDRRGWEWYLAYSALNPPHEIRPVSREPLRALAVSPDEKSAALAGDDGEISIWSCDKLEKIDSWHESAVNSLAWKGDLLAIGLANGEVVLREVEAKREQRRWKAHTGAVLTVKWNPVHDELATGGADGDIIMWSRDGTASMKTSRLGPVLSLDWQADGKQIAVVLGNPARLLADPPDALGHEYPMDTQESLVAWRPGANEVAVSMKDKPMRSFDPHLADDTFFLTSRYSPGVSAFAWKPDGKRIAVGGIDGKIMVVEPHEDINIRPQIREIRPVLYGHNRRITGLHWLKGERLLSIGDDGTLRRWDDLVRPGHVLATHFAGALGDARWHPREALLAVLVAGEEVQMLDATRRITWARPMPPPVAGHLPFNGGRLAWSPDGRWLAAVCPGRGLAVWRLEDGERLMPANFVDASDVHWLADNQAMLVHTARGWFRVGLTGDTPDPVADPSTVWMDDLGGGLFGRIALVGDIFHFKATLQGAVPSLDVPLPKDLGDIHACALSADRAQLAIGGETGVLVWLNTRSGKLTHPGTVHASAIQALGWNHDGSRLVTASADRTCRVFDVAQVAQTWALEHQLDLPIVAAGWSHDGLRLTLASATGSEFKTYEIPPADNHPPAARAAILLDEVKKHPGEEATWIALLQELLTRKGDHVEVLRAAAQLGWQARFSPLPGARLANASSATEWDGIPLPLAVQVAQACALERWEDVVTLSNGNTDPAVAGWFALAKAEALAHLGRQNESEAANLVAWQAVRQEHGAHDPATIPTVAGDGSSTLNLTRWATAHPTDDWVTEDTRGTENNTFGDLPALLPPQPDGVVFKTGDFVLLAGKTLRLATRRMLPRSTGWIPLNVASKELACVVAACNCDKPENYAGICVGSIFLLRQDGSAVRIPLVFGQNIWRWWVPDMIQPFDAPEEAVAWKGWNPRARYFNQHLRLYRLNWKAKPGESPVVAISIVSTMRQPAPLLMSVDAQP